MKLFEKRGPFYTAPFHFWEAKGYNTPLPPKAAQLVGGAKLTPNTHSLPRGGMLVVARRLCFILYHGVYLLIDCLYSTWAFVPCQGVDFAPRE